MPTSPAARYPGRFIHFVEQGRSRPSEAVLDLIAQRTGKPRSYFELRGARAKASSSDLAGELLRLANRLRRFGSARRLSAAEREAMKVVEVALRQGSALTQAIESGARSVGRGGPARRRSP